MLSSCYTHQVALINRPFSPDPSNITDDDSLTDMPPGTQQSNLSSVCRCEHLAECQVIHVLVRGRDHEGEGD